LPKGRTCERLSAIGRKALLLREVVIRVRDARHGAVGLVLVALMTTAGCGGTGLQAQEAITVGVILPFTSGVPGAARAAQQGAALAADERGARRASEATVTLIVEDDRGSPIEAARAFQRLLDRGVVASVGPLTDLTVTAVAPLAERAKVAVVSPGATGTIPYAGSSVFRTSLPAQAQARVLAEYLVHTLRARRISIIHEGNDYGTMVAMAFATRARELQAEVVGTRLYRDGDTEFTRHANGVLADGADAVFVAGYPDEGARILAALRERGVQARIVASDAMYSTDLLEWAKDAAEGVLVPAAFVPSEPIPAVADFVDKYRRRFNATPDHFAAQGYDAVKVLLFAARRAGRDPAAVRAALAGVRRFPGVTGEITFDRFGAPDRPVAIARVRAGAFEIVRR
jgi:branched-chain amino acid transport system substrate-binding protein